MPRSQICPSCSSTHSLVLQSRAVRSGARRRRHECCKCGHRWTTFADRRGRLIEAPPHSKPAPHRKPGLRKLDTAGIQLILTRQELSLQALAKQLQVSRETIRQVRAGLSYVEVLPDLPRHKPRMVPVQDANGPNCHRCSHWRAGCGFGLPDPDLEGPAFAADCSIYEPLSQSSSRA